MSFDEKLFDKLGEKINLVGNLNDFGPFQADLNDLFEACTEYLHLIDKLSETDDKEQILDFLIEIEIILQHQKFHIKSGIEFIEKILSANKK